MAAQVPMLHVPVKKTDEVDFTLPFKAYIQNAYQEDPEKYAAEIGTLNRLRQDIRGAGKDITGRDILYRYYGQLELLDLRFPIDEKHVKVVFTWYDAFTSNKIAQHSVAYEKACVIFNLAAVCSSIAALQNRTSASALSSDSGAPSSPTSSSSPLLPAVSTNGLKMAFNYFQGAAGLFQYINDNFLHPPSIDLGRDSIRCLSELMLAQAQECFLEKVVAEKKRGMLPAKLASQAAGMYANVGDALGAAALKTQFDKTWALLCQVKSKYFLAVANYHRGLACESESKYGEGVSRLQLAEIHAKEANKLASSFASTYPTFTTSMDSAPVSSEANQSGGIVAGLWGVASAAGVVGSSAGTSASVALLDATRMLLSNVTDKKNLATKDNDLIYHDSVPSTDSLSPIEKLPAVKPLTFADLCTGGAADIPKIVGPDIFAKLVPMAVHESASMYSEEKAKLLRNEEEKVGEVDGELAATLESMDVVRTLDRLRRMAKNPHAEEQIPSELATWTREIGGTESGRSGDSAEELLQTLEGLKGRAREALSSVGVTLDEESRECEGMRLKFPDWPQEPSARLTSSIRSDVKRHRETLDAAAETDRQVLQRMAELKPDVNTLKKPLEEVENIYLSVVSTGDPKNVPTASLIEEDVRTDSSGLGALGEQMLIEKMDNLLARIRQLKKERGETFEEFRNKLLSDDISNLLILNKNKEAALFQTELGKFKSYTQKLATNMDTHRALMQELVTEYEHLKERSYGMKLIESREKRRHALMSRWRKAFEGWKECRDGLQKGIQFYSGLTDAIERTAGEAKAFVRMRAEERNSLASSMQAESAERGQRLLKEQLERLKLNGPAPPLPDGAGSPANGYSRSPALPGGQPPLPPPPTRPPGFGASAPSAPAPYSPTSPTASSFGGAPSPPQGPYPQLSAAPGYGSLPGPAQPPPIPVQSMPPPPVSAYAPGYGSVPPTPVATSAAPVAPAAPYGYQQPPQQQPSYGAAPMPPQQQYAQPPAPRPAAPPQASYPQQQPYPAQPPQSQPQYQQPGPPPLPQQQQQQPQASYGAYVPPAPAQGPGPAPAPAQPYPPSSYGRPNPPAPGPGPAPSWQQPQQQPPPQHQQQQQYGYQQPPAPQQPYYQQQYRPEPVPAPPLPNKPGALGGPPPPLPPGAQQPQPYGQQPPAPYGYNAPPAPQPQRQPSYPSYAPQGPPPQQQPYGGYQQQQGPPAQQYPAQGPPPSQQMQPAYQQQPPPSLQQQQQAPYGGYQQQQPMQQPAYVAYQQQPAPQIGAPLQQPVYGAPAPQQQGQWAPQDAYGQPPPQQQQQQGWSAPYGQQQAPMQQPQQLPPGYGTPLAPTRTGLMD